VRYDYDGYGDLTAVYGRDGKKTARFRLQQPHHGRTQPARRTGIPLRIRPLRRQDKLTWTSTDPKRTHFVWDGTRLLQEYTYKGSYTYIYTDQDEAQYLAYFHTDHIGIPREMTDIHGNLLWYGEYTA